jgi:RimJ/RimL family protein N-acetyltransferase
VAAPDIQLPFDFPAPLRTERLVLRYQEEGDIDDVHAYRSREDVCRYMLHEPRTREETAEKVRQYAADRTLATADDYWQIAVDLDGRVIGDVYFAPKRLEDGAAEIGWSLHPDFGGRGYMTEAARAMIGLAFREMRFHRIFAELDARNDASAALCERLGMRREALYLEDMWFKGEWADTLMYGVLASEWQH